MTMTVEEKETYGVLLKEIKLAMPVDRINRIYHLREFVEIVNLRQSGAIAQGYDIL